MLSERPFVACHVARQVRKMASYKFRNNQFTETQFDQFMAKCRASHVIDQLCDIIEEDEDFDWKDFKNWLGRKWSQLRSVVDAFEDVDLTQPLGFYQSAPVDKGRKARRALPPAYETDAAFIADKELFFAELEGRVEDDSIYEK